MTSQERAALVTSVRPTTMSSQLAAITAASDSRDDDSPPASNDCTKGKLDQIKQEDVSMEIKQEMEEEAANGHMDMGGKGIKAEIKREESDMADMSEEIQIKTERSNTPDSSIDVKPVPSLEMIQPTLDKKRKCGE